MKTTMISSASSDIGRLKFPQEENDGEIDYSTFSVSKSRDVF